MIEIRRLSIQDTDFQQQLQQLLAWEGVSDESVQQGVKQIIAQVRQGGDQVLVELTNRFDRTSAQAMHELVIEQAELQQALERLPQSQRDALTVAAQRIRDYHQRQLQTSWRYTEADGTVLGQQITPLDSVGLYVPAGTAPLASSVLMNAIPAQVAGVQQLVMVSPMPEGKRSDFLLAAAALAGITRVFAIGGAQAVAALAYGTQTVPAVDKIVGPGNTWVATAKREVFGKVGIDMIAGPSEILVVSDGSTSASWLAEDMFSQAEHDTLAQSILISTSAEHLEAVAQAMSEQVETHPRADIIRKSLADRGALILVDNEQQALDLINQIAPEHLELSVSDPESWLPGIRHAGAIFMGAYSAESLGDYCAGPNHVLPTSGSARFSSPLGVYDFQKRSSIIFASAQGANKLGKVAAELARGEGLEAHARSALCRVTDQRGDA